MLFCVISLLLFACWAQAQDLRRHRKQRFVVPNHEGESLVEAKLDNERSLLRQEVSPDLEPSGTTWLCFTDQLPACLDSFNNLYFCLIIQVASYWTRLLQGPATQVTSLSVTFSVDPFSIDPFSIDPFSFAFTDTPTAAPTEGLITLDIDDDFEVSCSGKMSSGVASCGGGKMSGPGTSKGKSKGGTSKGASKGGTSKGTGSETSKGKGGKMSSTSAPATAPVDVVSLGEDDDDDDVASPVGKGGKMSSSGKMSGGKMSRGLMERLR